MKTAAQFLKEFDENGFSLLSFPEALRAELVAYIENNIRELSSSFIGQEPSKKKPLKEVALSVPDAVWGEKMTRAFRIFPHQLGQKLFDWANQTVRNPIGKTQSAVNVVYPDEIKTNAKLDETSLAIYWRCVRPGKPDAGRAHRDASFWELENGEGFDPKIPFPYNYLKDCIKLWIPLKGCTPTTTLQIIPKSHKMDIPTIVEPTEYGRRPSITKEWLTQFESHFISPIEISQGSPIAFDMNLVHRGPTHENTELRLSAELCLVVQ